MTILVSLAGPRVQATASSYLNFQSRLLTSSGAIVPDGTYNIDFKIYNADSTTGTVGTCSGACLWEETYLVANPGGTIGPGVTVTNGYMSVNLGKYNAFPSTINWDQQLWLTMNLTTNGTTSCSPRTSCTWDGEMQNGGHSIQLTALPLAFDANQLANTVGGNRGTLSFDTMAQATTILLPDPGTTSTQKVCYWSSASCGFIQNSGSVQSNANFAIQSAAIGTVGGLIRGASGQTADLLDLQTNTPTTVVSVSATGVTTISRNESGTNDYSFGVTGTTVADAGSSLVRIGNAITSGSGNGTFLGINAPNGSTADFLDIQNNGTKEFVVTSGGAVTANGNISLSGTSPVTISSTATNGTLNVNANGTGTLALDTTGAGTVNLGNSNATTIQIGGTSNASTTIGGGAAVHTVNIANASGANNSTVAIANGVTGGSNTASVTIGSANAAGSTVLIQGGNGATAIQLQTAGSGTVGIGNNAVANTIQIGTTSAQGAGGTTQSINIGNLNTTGTTDVTIGTGTSASGGFTTVQANGALTLTGGATSTWSIGGTNQNLTIQTSGTGTLAADTTGAGTVNLGNGNATTIQIGGASGATTTIGGGTNAHTIHIADGATTTSQTVTIGSAVNTTSNLTLQGGTGGSAIVLQAGATGGAAGQINIGNSTGANTQTIAIGTNGTASSNTTVNIGSTIAGTTTLQSAGGVKVTTRSASTSNSSALCWDNSTNLLTACDASNTTGKAFLQNGNGFGALAVIGTTDSQGFQIVTNGTANPRATFDTSNNLFLGNASTTAGTAAVPVNFTIQGTSSTNAGNTNGGSLTIQAGSGAGAGNNNGGNLTLQGGNKVNSGVAGGVIVKPQSDTTNAFQIQNASGTNLVTVDTTSSTGNNLVANPSFESAVSNWSALNGGSAGVQSSAQAFEGTKSLWIATGTSGGGSSYSTGGSFLSSNTTYTLSAYVKTDSTLTFTTFEMGYSNPGTFAGETSCLTAQTIDLGWTRFTCTFTTGTVSGSPFIYFRATDTSNRNIYVDDLVLQTDDATAGRNATSNYKNAQLNLQGTIVNSSLQIQTSQNNSTALQVQNSSGTQIFNVDTTDTNLITNPGIEVNSTGWAAQAGTTAIRRDTTQSYSGIASLRVATSATASSGARFTLNPIVTKVSTQYTLSWYALLDSGSNALTTLTALYSPDGTTGANASTCSPSSGTVVTTGWTRYSCTFTSTSATVTTSGFVQIVQGSSDTSTHTFYLDGVQLEQAAAATDYAAGGLSWNALIQSPTTFKSVSNSTTAFQVQVAAGYNMLGVDTTNATVKIYDGTSSQHYISLSYNDGTSTGTIAVDSGTTAVGNGNGPISITAGSNSAVTITANAASTWSTTAGALTIQGNGGLALSAVGANNITLTSNNASAGTLIASNTNSATALQIQNSSSKSLFTADTSGGQVVLGTSSAGGITGKLTFDNTTNANTAAIQSGATSSSYTWTLPTADASGCIKSNGSGTLSISSCSTTTLAGDYANGASQTDSTLALDSTRLGIIIKDNSTPISGSLFTVQNNAGTTKFLDVRSNGFDITGAGASTINTSSGNLSLLPSGNVVIGTSDTTGTLLVLDTDTNSTYNAGIATNASAEVDGAMFYSSTDHNLLCGIAGAWETCSGLLYSNTSVSSGIQSCTSGCAAYGTNAPIPANYCQAGRVIHIRASGTVSTIAAGSTIAWGVYYGTDGTTRGNDTQIGVTTPTSVTLTSAAAWGWILDFTIVCFSTTSMNGQGFVDLQVSGTANVSDNVYTASTTSATTVTSNSAKNLYIFPTYGTTNASNTSHIEQLIVTGN